MADNLVEGDSNGGSDVFIRDLVNGTTERIGSGHGASISDDGRYVTFLNGNVFVRDLLEDRTTQVSLALDGSQPNNASYDPAISGDGRYVSFYSDASNLVADDTNGIRDVFVIDGLAQGWWSA